MPDPQSYAVNHLSKEGISAVTNFWDEYIFDKSQIIRDHINNYHADFFEDPLKVSEHSCGGPIC